MSKRVRMPISTVVIIPISFAKPLQREDIPQPMENSPKWDERGGYRFVDRFASMDRGWEQTATFIGGSVNPDSGWICSA